MSTVFSHNIFRYLAVSFIACSFIFIAPAVVNACTLNLSLGSEGSQVTCLQQMLTLTKDYTYGEITGYFGPVTQAAIQKFQARMNIVNSGTPASTGYGNAGPITRLTLLKEALKILQTQLNLLLGTTPPSTITDSGGGDSGGGSAGGGSEDVASCVDKYVETYTSAYDTSDPTDDRSSSFQFSSLYFDPPEEGFFADGTNYFNAWQCRSSTGITTIRKLNIAPLGTHASNVWKDSLYLSPDEWSGGFPVVYFTQGVRRDATSKTETSIFNLRKAYFHSGQNKWLIEEVLSDEETSHGISSQDGRKDHYVMNDYQKSGCYMYGFDSGCFIPGWGPTANKPGSKSLIPGVREESTGKEVPSYPLYGTGTKGLDSIINAGDNGCVHMNPTLFDYDANKSPQKMAVELWDFASGYSQDSPCSVTGIGAPNDELPVGTYIYAYEGTALGWQLQYPNPGHIPVNTLNAVSFTQDPWQFLRGNWEEPVELVELDKNLQDVSQRDLLDCTVRVGMGEVTGFPDAFIFLGSEAPYYDEQNGLDDTVLVHDVYIATKVKDSSPIERSVAKTYRDILGRNPLVIEGLVWRGQGNRLREALIPLVTSRVTNMYKAIFGASPSSDVMKSTEEKLLDGASLKEIVEQFADARCSL